MSNGMLADSVAPELISVIKQLPSNSAALATTREVTYGALSLWIYEEFRRRDCSAPCWRRVRRSSAGARSHQCLVDASRSAGDVDRAWWDRQDQARRGGRTSVA